MREWIQGPVIVKAAQEIVTAAKAFLYTTISNESQEETVKMADLDLGLTLHSLRARLVKRGTLPSMSGFMTVASSTTNPVIS